MKKNTKSYYIGVKISDNKTLLATSMQDIAVHIGVNAKTISRHLSDVPWYRCDEYIIVKCLEIKKIERGFRRKM